MKHRSLRNSILTFALAALALWDALPVHAEQIHEKLVAVRYLANGALDTSFGSGGSVVTDIANSKYEWLHSTLPTTVTMMNDRVLAAGVRVNAAGAMNLMIARYNASNGALDTAFGTGGIVTTDVAAFPNELIYDVTVDGMRRIVVAGMGVAANGRETALVARYTAAGVLDTSFGKGGVVTGNSSTTASDRFFTVEVDPMGRVVPGGYQNDTNDYQLEIVRYSAGGALDTSFGTGGRVLLNPT